MCSSLRKTLKKRLALSAPVWPPEIVPWPKTDVSTNFSNGNRIRVGNNRSPRVCRKVYIEVTSRGEPFHKTHKLNNFLKQSYYHT